MIEGFIYLVISKFNEKTVISYIETTYKDNYKDNDLSISLFSSYFQY